jgi:DNA repair exonuclease SbcCD ATPase subunit
MGVQAETEAVDRNELERGADTDRLPPLLRDGPAGALDDLLDHRPAFRRRRHGYDRLQVDNYVTWAESELASARRYADHLLARYGECAARLELARRETAAPQRDVDLSAVSDRLGELLRLAADEAAEVTAAGVDEAERILGEARQEADARLANVAVLREAATAAVAEAHQDRAAAAEQLRRARAEAADLLQEAAAERSRLAAEAAAGLAAVQAEVDDLRRQRDEARQSLRRLTDGIGQALQAVDVRVTGNFVAPAPGTQPVG